MATLLFVSGCDRQPTSISSVPHPEPLIYRCFEMNATHAAPILGEPISLTQTIDYAHQFCIFASEQPNPEPIAKEGLLPIYGSLDHAEYVAVSIGERDIRDDTVTEFIIRLIQDDSKVEKRILDQFSQVKDTDGFNVLLAQLAIVENNHPDLSRQFIPRAGNDKEWSGALWLWQVTSTGQPIATLFAFNRYTSITIQALLDLDQRESDSQKQIVKLLEYLIEVTRNAPI